MGIVGSIEVCVSFHSVAGIVVSAPLLGRIFLVPELHLGITRFVEAKSFFVSGVIARIKVGGPLGSCGVVTSECKSRSGCEGQNTSLKLHFFYLSFNYK